MAIDFLRQLSRRRCALVLTLLGLAAAGGLAAQPELTRYVWYDLATPRAVWLNRSLVAQIDSAPGDQPAKRRSLAGLRVINATPGSAYHARRLPVFHTSASAQSPPLVLTAAVIVYLDPAWSADRAAAWLAARKLRVKRRLQVRPNAFLIAAAPGIAALELANALYESGEVVGAFPDWLRSHALR